MSVGIAGFVWKSAIQNLRVTPHKRVVWSHPIIKSDNSTSLLLFFIVIDHETFSTDLDLKISDNLIQG